MLPPTIENNVFEAQLRQPTDLSTTDSGTCKRICDSITSGVPPRISDNLLVNFLDNHYLLLKHFVLAQGASLIVLR